MPNQLIFKPTHPRFIEPVKSYDYAAAYDLFMPESGILYFGAPEATKFSLGFTVKIPEGYGGLLIPRSGKGAKLGLELNNTVGLVDPDYTDTVYAYLRNKNAAPIRWNAGDRMLQLVIAKVANDLEVVVTDDELPETTRGKRGFGSTGD